MAFAPVNNVAVTGVASPATTAGINTTGVTLIVVGIRSTFGTATLTDSYSNTWALIVTEIVGGLYESLYWCANPAVGSGHTFTGTHVGDQPGIFVSTYSGAIGGLDVFAGNAINMPGGSTSANFQPGSVTPTNINSLIVSFVGTVTGGFGAPLSTIDSGFTTTDVVTGIGGMAYLVETSIVAQNPNWATLNDGQAIGGINAVFYLTVIPAALYDDNFSSYSLGQVPPYGNLGLYTGSFSTVITNTPTGPFGDPQCVNYYIPSSRLKYPAATLSPSLPFYTNLSVFMAYRLVQNLSLQSTPLNFVSNINETGSSNQLLVVRIEQDGTFSFTNDPSNPGVYANSLVAPTFCNDWMFIQCNVSFGTDSFGFVTINAQLAVNEIQILSFSGSTTISAASLPGTYVNGIIISGGSQAAYLGRVTIFPSIHAIAADPHPGTPLARVSQGVIEVVALKTTANARVSQGVIELILKSASTLTATCPLATAAVGVPYSGQIIASGGTPPYTFAKTSGSFPPGITLNASTGILTGTPTTAGGYSWTVTVTDAIGSTFPVSCNTLVPPQPITPSRFCVAQP